MTESYRSRTDGRTDGFLHYSAEASTYVEFKNGSAPALPIRRLDMNWGTAITSPKRRAVSINIAEDELARIPCEQAWLSEAE